VPVDLLLTGGRIHTVDAARTTAEAVAVAGGRIEAVGTAAELAGLAGPETRVVELTGRMVLPGFQDAHLHPPHGGLSELHCSLHETTSREECLATISGYAKEHPDREWVIGDGWSMDSFPGGTPLRADLDAILPDRPGFFVNRDGHGAWANSKALELAGVTRETPDPADGRIERDAQGEPAGTLQEGAIGLVERLVPETTPEEWEEAIRRAQARLHAWGITAWQDATVEPETLRAYRALAERGDLTMRTEGNLRWTRERGEEQLDDLLARREQGMVGRLRIRGAKIFQDGVLENFTGAVLEPYLDGNGNSTGNRGIGMHDPEELAHIVTLLDREGFQVHIHALADRAVRESLDAIAAAQDANGRRDARHHLAHLQLVHPDDVPRFRALGVVANCQPLWACLSGYVEELTLPFLTEETGRTMYPFGSLHRAGASLAFGSDWTVSTADPLPQLEVAVTRIYPGERGEPLLPDERLDLPTALAAFTIGSAYVNGLELETGSIEPGKLADLVVLDRDLLAPDAGLPSEARVLATFVEGQAVFEAPEFPG
jgi:predicted amidohydrolase YtcJ